MTDLAGRVAIVTGGASGIGAETARQFVDRGASVVVADLDEVKGSRLVEELGERAGFLRTDVSNESDVAAMVLEADDRFGGVDILFNNAGFGGALGPIAETSLADYDLTFDVLLKSVFLGVKHASPAIAARGGGVIINTASVAGISAGYAPHLYTAAKAAVIALTETVALELAEQNIRCNAVCPGLIVTPLLAGHPGADEKRLADVRAASAAAQPMGRAGDPADIANMVVFLASDEAAWITGQAMVVDGGLTAGPRWSEMPEPFRITRPIRHHRPPDR